MRLTLRTLLAYLDDALEPHETREIGKKIQESPVAAGLVSRVREVIRRRRLGAPDVDGPSQGVDPNVVAQYLDNSLAPEEVGQFESICLESDLVLAEVAACHQVLSLILGEPIEVPIRSRERFYAIGPVSAEAQLQVTRADSPKPVSAPAERNERPREVATNVTVSEAAGYFRDEMAGQLKQTPWSQRVGPAAGAALVVVAVVLVLLLDRDLFRGIVKKSPSAAGTPEEIVAATDTPRTRPVSPDRNGRDAVISPVDDTKSPEMKTAPPAEVKTTTPLVNLDPPPPPDAPEPKTTPLPKPPLSPDVADATTVVPAPSRPVVTGPTPRPPAVGVTTPVEPVVNVPMQSTGVEGVLLRYNPGDQYWYVQPRRSDVHPMETFACPEPFEGLLEWDKGDLKATLLGETTVQILAPTEKQRYGLLIRRGRVLLQPGPMAKTPLTVNLQIGNQTHAIVLVSTATLVGVEVKIEDPAGLPTETVSDPWRAVLFVASGGVEMADGAALSAKQFARLTPQSATENLTAGSQWPAWLDPLRRAQLSPLRRYAQHFEKEFDPSLAVNQTIPALMRDPKPQIAELGARCLAVMESYPSLIQSLVQSEHEEARLAAAAGLRSWLAVDRANGELLKQELSTHIPGDEARAVERLLWGYTPAEARDRLLSLELVEWLRSNRVEVRELAFQQLVRLTGRRYDYRPLGSASQREPAIQRWQAHITREGALLKSDE